MPLEPRRQKLLANTRLLSHWAHAGKFVRAFNGEGLGLFFASLARLGQVSPGSFNETELAYGKFCLRFVSAMPKASFLWLYLRFGDLHNLRLRCVFSNLHAQRLGVVWGWLVQNLKQYPRHDVLVVQLVGRLHSGLHGLGSVSDRGE